MAKKTISGAGRSEYGSAVVVDADTLEALRAERESLRFDGRAVCVNDFARASGLSYPRAGQLLLFWRRAGEVRVQWDGQRYLYCEKDVVRAWRKHRAQRRAP